MQALDNGGPTLFMQTYPNVKISSLGLRTMASLQHKPQLAPIREGGTAQNALIQGLKLLLILKSMAASKIKLF
jgi:hypothetical protein